jgi:hypothetical protein
MRRRRRRYDLRPTGIAPVKREQLKVLDKASGFAKSMNLLVAQTGGLLYRGLPIRNARVLPIPDRLPVGDTADCQSAQLRQPGSEARGTINAPVFSLPP